MESPAVRVTRILGVFCLTLLAVSLVAILDEGGSWSESYVLVIALMLAAAMRVRLEYEMEEASMQRIGTSWAKMEMDHLESRHSEE